MSRATRFLPLVVLLLVIAALVWRLVTPADRNVRSKMEGKPVPAFELAPMLPGKPGLSSADLATGEPHLLNIFASWCVPCITELKVLQEMKAGGIAIDGIALRDRPADVAAFLARNGDPYDRIGEDREAQLQIALGSSGVPESFVIDGRGIVRYQHIGPIERSDIQTVLAELERAK